MTISNSIIRIVDGKPFKVAHHDSLGLLLHVRFQINGTFSKELSTKFKPNCSIISFYHRHKRQCYF